MKRIAFEFDRTAINGGAISGIAPVAARHRRSIRKEFSGNRPLAASRERNEVHFRTAAAG